MKTAKIGVIFLISVMTLAGVSAGYSLWFEDLTIEGTINTGTFNVDWSIEDIYDNEAKDISWAEAEILDDDLNTLYVTIFNAYPCVTYTIEFDLHSTGTVPAHFVDWYIDAPDYVEITLSPLEETNQAGEIVPLQLHEDEYFYGKLTVHLTNDAPQGAGTGDIPPITFKVKTRAYQYNEDPGFSDEYPLPWI